MAYTLIQTLTVGAGGASSIDFNSIPNSFTDICIKLNLRATDGASAWQGLGSIAINGVTTNQSSRYLYGSGSTATSTNAAALEGWSPANASTSNTFGNWEIYIPNYAGSNNKTITYDLVTENNAAAALSIIYAGLWSSTSAITRITFNATANFAQYSIASLYGIK
jgi:hypothetical protein